jgi:hypothetical protein
MLTMINFLTHNLITDKQANSFQIQRIGEEVEDAICCRATKSVTKRFQTTLVEDAICCRATKSATKRFQTALSKKKLEITHH